MAERYPLMEPYETGMLPVGDEQTLYWETVGNPGGTPAVFLHGGPGSGASPGARRNFDLSAYRAVLFDQRGCGRSRPLASGPNADLSTNTTDHLVRDLERLREHLGIERWVVVGVSWGVTLALVYAERYPKRVLGLVLGAVTTGARRETEWITRDMGRVFPREWERFASIVTRGRAQRRPRGSLRPTAGRPRAGGAGAGSARVVPLGGRAYLAFAGLDAEPAL